MQDIATPGEIYVQNGATADLAIPCWYQEVHQPVRLIKHNHHLHDHVGWPAPNHPDHVCQVDRPERTLLPPGVDRPRGRRDRYLDLGGLVPIHLSAEGYETITIAWADTPDAGVMATGSIDADDDWVVRVRFDVADSSAIDEKRTYRFTVFANAPATSVSAARRDIICLGKLIVLPGATGSNA